jgi:5'-nucleotidase
MTRLRWISGATVIAFVVAACTEASPPSPTRPPGQVQLLALNDFQGNLEPPSGSTGAIAGKLACGVEYLATWLA